MASSSEETDCDSGWQRVRSLFSVRYGDSPPEEVKELSATVLVASVTGFLFGGMIGARHAGDKYIALNHNTKYASAMQAQRELHGAAMLGFVRQGAKWGWKTALFAGIFSGTASLLSVYRDKDGALNYIAAGGVTGGLFRVSRGVKPAIGGTVLGLLISLPAGLFLHGMDLILVGSEGRSKVRRERFHSRRQREEQWNKKLESTAELIEDLEVELSPSEGSGIHRLHTYYTTSKDSSEGSASATGHSHTTDANKDSDLSVEPTKSKDT